MKARAISTILTVTLLGSSVPAGAQDAGVGDASTEEDPTVGALPFEDPTIEPRRDEDLQVDESADAAPEVTATESSAGPADELSWPIGLMLRAQLRGTNRYVAWGVARRERLFWLCPRVA
jgi:hypothetical protein